MRVATRKRRLGRRGDRRDPTVLPYYYNSTYDVGCPRPTNPRYVEELAASRISASKFREHDHKAQDHRVVDKPVAIRHFQARPGHAPY